jgi:tetratricopeptide (TPR) repeat protein
MTSNHLLLYRLAELMLEYELHFLPVDLLFDDEQIGDFVKSIQIDSSYQQMLYEGVLTESVRDEKLFVSFTVEGYFHYVLGQVIYNQTNGKGPESLKQIVEESKLNGAKEGVEQCLIRDVLVDDLSRLMWLIDEGGKVLDMCSIPLANAFLKVRGIAKTEYENRELQHRQINRIFAQLFKDVTDNDITVLAESIDYLELVQKNQIVSLVYKKINQRIAPKSLKTAKLIIQSIAYIDNKFKNKQLANIEKLVFDKKNNLNYSSVFYSLAHQFYLTGKFQKALHYFKKSLRLSRNGSPKKSLIYNDIGVIFLEQYDYESALRYHKKSRACLHSEGLELEALARNNSNISICFYYKNSIEKSLQFAKQAYLISSSIYGSFHPNMSIIYSTIGNIFSKQGKFEDAINHFEDALNIQIKVFGENHLQVSASYNNLGNTYSDADDLEKAKFFYKKSLAVGIACVGENHPFLSIKYSNLGLLYEDYSNYQKAIDYHKIAYEINLKSNGHHHPETLESLFSISLCFYKLSNYLKSIEYFELLLQKDLTSYIPATNIDYFDYLASIYEALFKQEKALNYYIKSAEIRKHDIGLEDEATQEAITNSKRLAKELNKESELPVWMKKSNL